MQARPRRATFLALWALTLFACDQAHPGIGRDVQDVAVSTDVTQPLDVSTALDADDVALVIVDSGNTLDGAPTDSPLADAPPADATPTDVPLLSDVTDVVDVFTGPMPDFSLPDVNPNSSTYGMNVSPRGHLGEVTAWYFGHST